MGQRATNDDAIKDQWSRMDIEIYPHLFRFVVFRLNNRGTDRPRTSGHKY